MNDDEEDEEAEEYDNDHGLQQLGKIKAFAAKMGRALSQEAVALEVDHSLHFVPPLGVAVAA